MKIAVDANELVFKNNIGVKVYTREILNALSQIDTENEYSLFMSQKISDFSQFHFILNEKFRIREIQSLLPFWTYLKFPSQVKKTTPDILFMPIQSVPFFKKPKNLKIVVTVHDLAYLIFPDQFTSADRKKLAYHTKRAVNMADAIIVPSKATQSDLIQHYKIPSEKIHLIYHGTVSFPDQKNQLSSETVEIAQKVAEFKSYLLFVGTIQPRKNLKRLIDAFETVKEHQKKYSDLKLILVGKKGWMSDGIFARAKANKFASDIVFTGDISNNYLRELYKNALMFVFPSLYEGFGLPVLEAMSFGLPCIVSDNSSLSEIVDAHALLINAESSDDMAQKINMFLNHESLRRDYSLRSIKNASSYTWEHSAQKLFTVFNSLKDKL